AAHAAGVVHRDLKPNNIRITHDGRVKILDFGLAKVREGRLSPPSDSVAQAGFQTSHGMLLGTPPYMAPEQLRGAEVDERCDLFALGVVLYQMIAGETPYPVDNLLEYVKALANTQPTPLAVYSGAITEDQEAVITKLLAQDPKDRYSSATHAAQDLRAVGGLAPSTPVTLRRRLPVKSRSRYRFSRSQTLALAGAALLLVILGFALRWWSWQGNPKTTAILGITNATPDASLSASSDSLAELIYDHLLDADDISVVGPAQVRAVGSKSFTAIGRRFDAGTVVEGTLQSEDDTFVVSIRIYETSRGQFVWKLPYQVGSYDSLFSRARDISNLVKLMLRVWERVGRKLEASDFQEGGWKSIRDINFPEDSTEAVGYFSIAINADPGLASAYAGRSLALLEEFQKGKDQQRLSLAQADASKAVQLDQGEVMGHIALSRLDRLRGEYTNSISRLRTVLNSHGASDQILMELAVSLQEAGQSTEASSALKSAISLKPGHWDYWNQLGIVQWKSMGDLEAAEATFRKAQELAPPDETWPLANLVGILYDKQEYDQAVALARPIPRSLMQPELLSNLGTAYFAEGEIETARSLFQEAIQRDPSNPAYHRNLGDTLEVLGESEEAKASFVRAASLLEAELQLNPNQPLGEARLALYLAKSGDCDRSQRLATAYLESHARESYLPSQVVEALSVCGATSRTESSR
ncbi:MAG: tetratricopeptide repeat protein, partial [Acidobacteria bacterium]|nr:tetratricopeptide repeat protein [Acidobacteriota bacterium]